MRMPHKSVKTAQRRLGALCAAMTLAGAICLAAPPSVRAQDTATLPTQNVNITLSDAPVRTALDGLFKSTNLNYTIDPSIQEKVTVSLKNVPFDVALRAILHSSTPELQYTVSDGVYKISQPAADVADQSLPGVPTATGYPGVGGTGTGGPSVGYGPNATVGPNASASDTKQIELVYLTYAPGGLLNAVVGPVQLIQPSLYTPTYGGGAGGVGGSTNGGLGSTGGIGGSSGSSGFGGSSGSSGFGGSSGGFSGGFR